MADKQDDKQSRADEVEEPVYHADRLVAESGALLGVESHVAAGALSLARKQNLTRGEAKKLVEDFRKRTVTE